MPGKELACLPSGVEYHRVKRLQVELDYAVVEALIFGGRSGSFDGVDVTQLLEGGELAPLPSVAATGLQLVGDTGTLPSKLIDDLIRCVASV